MVLWSPDSLSVELVMKIEITYALDKRILHEKEYDFELLVACF
jgi:hypothetical protein